MLPRCAGDVVGENYNALGAKLNDNAEASRSHASSASSEATMMEPLHPMPEVAVFQKHVIKHKRSATHLVESSQPRLLASRARQTRCRSQGVSPGAALGVITARGTVGSPAANTVAALPLLTVGWLHQQPPRPATFPPNDDGLWMLGSDEMLLEIIQMLSLEDIVALCVASGRSHGLRIWMIARLHFSSQLAFMIWESAAAGSKTQAAAEMLQSVQDSFRERSSSREMFIEDVRLLERNQPRYELDLLEMYEKEYAMNLHQQAALTLMQHAMQCWDDVVKRKDMMELFVRRFSAKVFFLCGKLSLLPCVTA